MQELFKSTHTQAIPTKGKAIIQLGYKDKPNTGLLSLAGDDLSKQGRIIYNLAKVIAVAVDEKDFKVNDIISLYDDMLEAIPNMSAGTDTTGNPKAGFIPLGKLLPYYFTLDKFEEKQNELTFLIPTSLIVATWKSEK